ncbi:hypothetical protein [Oceanibaculum nanhaiense]|jgi:hypothetical protein|uniref:hypothetical protein n=1 Tax=Oceanibaculum nanhaiense TaxID=1909734 RepID=UPI000A3D53D7|nr:hypothetical protein [Oceanibaculum nanhaiense]MBC7135489.1 hypothetical protein [Oceanibaculum nanhaiense]
MSREHLKKKAQEALKEADGNASLAARLLHGWALEDQELLQALVKPMLPSLSLLAVQRAAGKDDGYRASRRRRSPPVTEKAALEAVAEALSGKRAPAMTSTRNPLTAPSEASTRHRSAVQFLASAYKPKS